MRVRLPDAAGGVGADGVGIRPVSTARAAAAVVAAFDVAAAFAPGLMPRPTTDQAGAAAVTALVAPALGRLLLAPARSRGRRGYACLGAVSATAYAALGRPAVAGHPVVPLIRSIAGRTAVLAGTALALDVARTRSMSRAAVTGAVEIAGAGLVLHQNIRLAASSRSDLISAVSRGAAIWTTGRVSAVGLRRAGRSASVLLPVGLAAGGLAVLLRRADRDGAAWDDAYRAAPDSACVSGGPGSVVGYATLGLEGRRLVSTALTPAEIDAAAGERREARPPVRVFVGLDSAPTPRERVALAMAELERTGAWRRRVLCVCSPTGSGFLDPVALESLEHLTDGDCAVVALQYSRRPSILSVDRVGAAGDQNRLLLDAVAHRLASLPAGKRPRVVGFGESLGAQTLQQAVRHEGVGGLAARGVERALFVGTPATSAWWRALLADPARTDPEGVVVTVDGADSWAALPDTTRERARIVLLHHQNDPVTRFEPALAWRPPSWLSPDLPRPRGVPHAMRWRPLLTAALTAIDVKNATSVVPGQFGNHGHDYRSDLAAMVTAAFDLPVPASRLAAVQAALPQRELALADRLTPPHEPPTTKDIA